MLVVPELEREVELLFESRNSRKVLLKMSYHLPSQNFLNSLRGAFINFHFYALEILTLYC